MEKPILNQKYYIKSIDEKFWGKDRNKESKIRPLWK